MVSVSSESFLKITLQVFVLCSATHFHMQSDFKLEDDKINARNMKTILNDRSQESLQLTY